MEDFWCVYSHIYKPTMLKANDAMMLFREGIQPEWEDLNNQAGGEWRVSFPPTFFSKSIDAYWENLLMYAIGEIFTHSEEVTGVYLKIKQQKKGGKDRFEYRISLWVRNSTQNYEEVLMSLGNEMKQCFSSRLDNVPRLDFRPHADGPGDKKLKLKIDASSRKQTSDRGSSSQGAREGGRGDRRNDPHYQGDRRSGFQRTDSRGSGISGGRGGSQSQDNRGGKPQRGSSSRGGQPQKR